MASYIKTLANFAKKIGLEIKSSEDLSEVTFDVKNLLNMEIEDLKVAV